MDTTGNNDGCIVLVLGMHRSGTSVLTNCLANSGITIVDDVLPPDVHVNADGFFEDSKVVDLNEKLLGQLHRSWMDYRPPDPADTPELLTSWVDEACQHVASQYKGISLSALKDPRLCLTWRFWMPVFREAGITVRVVHILREPLEVAASLKRRDALPLDYGLLLWVTYVLSAAEAAQTTNPSATLTYEFLCQSPMEAIGNVFDSLKLDGRAAERVATIVQPPAGAKGSVRKGHASEDLEALALRIYKHFSTDEALTGQNLSALRSDWSEFLDRFDHRWEALRETAQELQSMSQGLVEIGEMHRHALAVLKEKDRALKEKDQVLTEKDQALKEKDQVLTERDLILADRNRLLDNLHANWLGRLALRLAR